VKVLTEKAKLVCTHQSGRVLILAPRQDLVKIDGNRVLVRGDPERKPIVGCSNVGPTIKPCTLTLRVSAGYSALVRIDGRSVCLHPLTGSTDGTPPAAIRYVVVDPGQTLVEERV
jgi:hypothetical protein